MGRIASWLYIQQECKFISNASTTCTHIEWGKHCRGLIEVLNILTVVKLFSANFIIVT